MNIKKDNKNNNIYSQFSFSHTEIITITDLASLTSTNKKIIKELIEHELISPCKTEKEPCFTSDILPKVCKMLRLHFDLNVSLSSMDLVLDLLDRVESLEKQINSK